MMMQFPKSLSGSESPLVDMAEFPSWIVFENEDLLVLDKPGWLVCHPSKNGPLSSLAGAAREYLKTDSLHLVSRLDRETSGLVAIAKNKRAASIAQKAVEKRLVSKTYLALLTGKLLGTVTVSQPLCGDENSLVAVKDCCCMRKTSAKDALTVFKSLRAELDESAYTLVRVRTPTGRKHQIRAHAQWIGHHIVGDKLYGGDETLYLDFINNGMSERLLKILKIPRQALHAWRLDFSKIFDVPVFTAPLPGDIAGFAEAEGVDLSAASAL